MDSLGKAKSENTAEHREPEPVRQSHRVSGQFFEHLFINVMKLDLLYSILKAILLLYYVFCSYDERKHLVFILGNTVFRVRDSGTGA